MEDAYINLINDLLGEGDLASAQAALRQKMDAGDGMAYALFGLYVYTGVFADHEHASAFEFWEKGAALGDCNCKGLSLFKQANLSMDDDQVVTLDFPEKAFKQVLNCAAEGGFIIYEFLLKWVVTYDFTIAVSDRQVIRLLTEGLAALKKTSPNFLVDYAFRLFCAFNNADPTDEDWSRLLHLYKDYLTPAYPEVCYCVVAEFLSCYPDLAKPKELYKYLSYIKESMPEEYHSLMCVIKDMQLRMNEVIVHAEEANRLSKPDSMGRIVYAYCLLKGKGVPKNLPEAERLLPHDDLDLTLTMRAHCRMFVDSAHPDIEGALKLLDGVDETDGSFYDKMLYLLYAESKGALPAAYKQRLCSEMSELEMDSPKEFWFFKGVQKALSKPVDEGAVVDCFDKSDMVMLPVVIMWLCGHTPTTDYSRLLEEIVHDESIDTDMRYQLACKLVVNLLSVGEREWAKEVFDCAVALGGTKYARRNHFFWQAMTYLGETDLRKRKTVVNQFLPEYEAMSEEELKEQGMAHYLRFAIELDSPHPNRKRLKALAERTVDSQDSYAMICVGHILMEMKQDPELLTLGTELERMGLEILPFCRMDWIIESITGGHFASFLI